MSSSLETNNNNNDNSDGKIATEASPPGVNSITNTVGMQPTSPDLLIQLPPPATRRASCDKPGCTDEHSGKPHE